MTFNTILEATTAWQNEFNTYPYDMIAKLFNIDPDSWHEITPITSGCRVWSDEYQECAEVFEVLDNDTATIRLDSTQSQVCVSLDTLSREDETFFPMWGWMWSFGNPIDDWWLEKHLSEMAECGFRIYESDEFGYFFGIDGAGYDFYEAHWIPLYKSRGLLWHKEE